MSKSDLYSKDLKTKISKAYLKKIKLKRASKRQKKILRRFKPRWTRARILKYKKTSEISTIRSRLPFRPRMPRLRGRGPSLRNRFRCFWSKSSQSRKSLT